MENGQISLAATLALAGAMFTIIGGVIARDRNISKRISDGDGKVHIRIDDLKDDLNESFARKDDVEKTFARIESGQAEIRQDIKALTSLIIADRNK